MASPSELSLDCKPHSYSMLLKSFADQQYPDQTLKLEDFLSRLEEERLKIDAFKRELPLCMQLLTNAVESSRQQLQAYRGNNNNNIQGTTRPILEEFIPLKTSSSELGSEKTTNTSDKANWMTSVQLWGPNSATSTQDHGAKQLQSTTSTTTINKTTSHQITKDQLSPHHDHISFNVMSPKLTLDTKIQRNNGGAFLPFSKGSCPRPLPELALAALAAEKEADLEDKKSCLEGSIENGNIIRRESTCGTNNNNNNANNGSVVVIDQGKGISGNLPEGQTNCNVANNINNNCNNNNNNTTNGSTTQTSNNNNSQTHRKARRCWSPDLHRRFVSALQMLGGSQVATPKQIRELMKVDGLTNDEVKSHLQKYRLHTRRPSPSPSAAGGPTPQLVVLGSIWVPPEYAHGGGPTATLYSSHAPPHYCGPPVPQDHFYGGAPSQAVAHHQHQHHHQQFHHQLHVYNKAGQGSPESEVRGGPAGDRSSESIEEDGKSESGSWKADSSDRKLGLAALRDDAGEESNGSEITLKF